MLHPLALGALALLIVNDHVLKATYAGWWTGKLSDVAGLAMFPLLVAAGGQLIGLWPGGVRTVIVVAIATGAAFTAFKLWSPAGDVYRVGLAAVQWPARAIAALLRDDALPVLGRAAMTADPTDLLALPALLISPLVVRAHHDDGRIARQCGRVSAVTAHPRSVNVLPSSSRAAVLVENER